MTFKISMTRRISKVENMKTPSHLPKAIIGCRHIQILLLTLGFFCCYTVRIALSIALVAMTKSDSINSNVENYNWSDNIQNLILSSFFWGYVVTHIPGGELAQRFGAQKFLCFAVGICGIITILIPSAAKYGGWQAVIVIRILTGAAQGIIPPCLHILLSKWAPVEERGRAGTCTYSGALLGNVVTLMTCGAISDSPLGWPSCFYIWGVISILWAIIYYFVGKESPAEHPTIPLDEKEYIEISLGVTEIVEPLKTPWLSILTSVPVWALLITQCADSWGFWMLLIKSPAYMSNVLGYNMLENGVVSALPYLVSLIVGFPISFVCDKMVNNNYVSLNVMRKIANSIGLFIPALALIGFSFVNSDQRTLAVSILIISSGFNTAAFSGYSMNHIDLSPNFSGTLMALTNATANICGIMAPLICGILVSDVSNMFQWRNVFLLSAGVYIFGNLIFVLFGDANVQPWNNLKASKVFDSEKCMIGMTTLTLEKQNDNTKSEGK